MSTRYPARDGGQLICSLPGVGIGEPCGWGSGGNMILIERDKEWKTALYHNETTLTIIYPKAPIDGVDPSTLQAAAFFLFFVSVQSASWSLGAFSIM
jgi:hypothetical protein